MGRILITVLAGLAFVVVPHTDDAKEIRLDKNKIKGRVQQFDAKQYVLKIKVNEKEKIFRFKDDKPFVGQNGKPLGRQARIQQLVPGAQVAIIMSVRSDQQGPPQIAQVQIQSVRIKQKPNDKIKRDQISLQQKEKSKPDQIPAQKEKLK